MASIQKRITKEGRTTYRALVRIKGCPTRSATFDRCSGARRWSQEQEVDLRSTRPTCNIKNEQHTLGELVDRYISQILPDKKDIVGQTQQLNWWKTQLGDSSVSAISPAIVSECRSKLQKEGTHYGTPDQLLRSTGILQLSVMLLLLPGKNGAGSTSIRY